MGYRRLDVNLLPPELQPGPVVRYAVVINTILIGVTLAFLVVDSFLGLTIMASLRRDIQTTEDQIRSKSGVVADYNELIKIEDHIKSIGRLIALASADYVDLPVILDHITRLIPDGVYLESISTQGGAVGATTSGLNINLATSRQDPQLIVRTLNAFKADPMLQDCVMRVASHDESDLGPVLNAAGVNWQASGPDLPDYSANEQFAFQIQAVIYPPVNTENLGVSVDNTDEFNIMSFSTNASLDQDGAESQVTGAPEGVSVMEAN